MSKQSRRERWRSRVQKDRHLPAECRLFLIGSLLPRMKSDGTVSHPRRLLALDAGVGERQVGNYIRSARDAGWLLVVSHGHQGRTAVYQASFPDQIAGSDDCSLFELNSRKRKGTLSTPNSRNYRVPTTSSSTTRARSVSATNRSHLDRRCNYQTQVGKVERQRPHVLVAAQVERHPGGTVPRTRFDFRVSGVDQRSPIRIRSTHTRQPERNHSC